MIWKFLKKSPDKTPIETSPTEATVNHLPLSYLQKLIPLGDLPAAELLAIPATMHNFNPGDIIFNRGAASEQLSYLYTGTVYLEANNGTGYTINADTFKAFYPLATSGEHTFSAIAKSPTQVIYMPLSNLQHSSKPVNNPLINPERIPPKLRDSFFFDSFCDTFRADNLHVPSLPDVALRLRSALQKDISIADAVKILNLDPVISSKLIQVANSPIYRSDNPITSGHDAVNRLGFKTTQNLVTSISLHQLFRSRNRQLNNIIQTLWKQSIQIASLSHTLAGITRKINADEALLAGLIHNIGALPIVTFAESIDISRYTEEELQASIDCLQGLVGTYILKKWHFPDNFQQIPINTTHWYYDNGQGLQLHDVVLLAKFHNQLGGANTQKLPPLNTLPAFKKLDDSTLTPDMSLKALHDAKQQIADALIFFRT
ncbi:cyclic nucleotide-binding protein [Methylomonas albis]|uniref:HDOD domain-containing protein n=1 Tax=Methylomonas albis TaxID=1854563 RepID=A0ABR9CUU6_9GAMM|nr:HDOD domain-containing protein [Methylomonas albis]MBD9354559.1 HDOD domain-containing protein [Methylomonas albis]CAD6877449.1 cyclic nucleotide-binding protein [Methylomonas albis]